MRYIQTGFYAQVVKRFAFDSVHKTEYEQNVLPALKTFMEKMNPDVIRFTVNKENFLLYVLPDSSTIATEVPALFKLYSKQQSSKKDTRGIWGRNVINDYFTKGTPTDFWFCFDGDTQPWLVVKEDKDILFLEWYQKTYAPETVPDSFTTQSPFVEWLYNMTNKIKSVFTRKDV